ncbi:MAG: hypothetical protein M3Z23_18830 [Acidobacteriota bacterium]|nr:hypothetical protein [Acidobacteriota bacterium]
MIKPALWIFALLFMVALYADVATIKAEPNLEKRARLALTEAGDVLTTAQGAYEKGDLPGAQAALLKMLELVEAAQSALAETHKNPVRSPKHFKNAEVKSRELLKRIEGFERSMDFQDRNLIEPAKTKIQEIHDVWLLGIMGPKK